MLRWLAVGAGVTATHLLLLWSASDLEPGPGPELARSAVVPVALLDPAGPAASQPSPAPPTRPVARPRARSDPKFTPAAPAAADDTAAVSDKALAGEAKHEASAASPQEMEQPTAEPTAAEEKPAGQPTRALQAPASVRLLYELTGQGKGLHYSADVVLDWRRDEQRYQAMMEVSAFLIGSRSQASSGRLGTKGLLPERFIDRARRERVTQFDHQAGLARNEPGGSTLAMPDGTQDKLSVFIQLVIELSGLERPPDSGDSWTVPVAASSTIEQWTFDWRGSDELELPAGRILTWHLERRPLHPGDTRLEIWLAPELGLMPARLRLQQENGDRIDQRLLRR